MIFTIVNSLSFMFVVCRPRPNRLSSRAAARAGFTLMEMLLVCFLLAAMGAIAWPVISRAYEGVKLKNAGEQVQAAFNHARVEAMTSGTPRVFHFEPSTASYSVEVWQDGTEAVEGTAASGAAASGGFTIGAASGQTSSSGSGTATGTCSYTLPEGFVFVGAQRTLDNRTAAAEAGLSGSGVDTSTPPVLFYPDGTTSEVTITIANQNSRAISVSLRGLTGVARLGEITTTDAVGGTGS